MQRNLFDTMEKEYRLEELAPGACILHGFARRDGDSLLSDLLAIIQQSPFRYMTTPRGFMMSVAMTNCGS